MVYYEVNKGISPLKIHPRLFRSTLYGIRSNISEATIGSAQYDTLVAVFQDLGKHNVLNIEFQNPPFFKTRKELLSHAQFNIIDLDSTRWPSSSLTALTRGRGGWARVQHEGQAGHRHPLQQWPG